MIITVFVSTHTAADQWRAELLEQSWIEAGQSGELVRLVACPPDAELPMHSTARVVRATPCDPHPYIADTFAGYNPPAALLEWLLTEQPNATLLLLDPETIIRQPLTEEVEPGGAMGHRWRAWPDGTGPFGLNDRFKPLERYCVDTGLKPPRVELPVVIHSSDLRKMAARWLELTGLIRSYVQLVAGPVLEAHRVAYALAAAEYRVPHRAVKLAAASGDRKSDCAFLDYRQPVESSRGKIVWDAETYSPWSVPDAAAARAGAGRQFLSWLSDYVGARESGALLAGRRPRRCHGVREARLPDRMLLEIPGAAEPLQLNSSASAIWNLCDNQRTVEDMVDRLGKQFDVPRDMLLGDVGRTLILLRSRGALELDRIAP